MPKGQKKAITIQLCKGKGARIMHGNNREIALLSAVGKGLANLLSCLKGCLVNDVVYEQDSNMVSDFVEGKSI